MALQQGKQQRKRLGVYGKYAKNRDLTLEQIKENLAAGKE